ncbi:MAG: hypothetical protein C0616_09575 [Desulfuromonas sp.]|nr:MAG: hypothetical protein C0616_09575 [Desulfuromonas sp.]
MSYHEIMLLAAPLMAFLMGMTLFQIKNRDIPRLLLLGAVVYFAVTTQFYGPDIWWSYPAGFLALLAVSSLLHWLPSKCAGGWHLDEGSWITLGLVGLAGGLIFGLQSLLLYLVMQGIALFLEQKFKSDSFPPTALIMLAVVILMVTVRNLIPQWGFG